MNGRMNYLNQAKEVSCENFKLFGKGTKNLWLVVYSKIKMLILYL